LAKQKQEDFERKKQEQLKEKEVEMKCTGLEFECYTRDKMVAQDKKNLQKFLEEQMRDQ